MKSSKSSVKKFSLNSAAETMSKNIGVQPLMHKDVIPPKIFYLLAFISLGLPNLIYSGIGWFDTLHIMKWSFAMVPIAISVIMAGTSLALYGNERTDFKIDLFGWLWLIMLGYISVQPLWVNILSWSTYMKEWFFFCFPRRFIHTMFQPLQRS